MIMEAGIHHNLMQLPGQLVEALPMYNLTPARAQNHTKGRGNGYVVTIDKKRIYISGDTEDIPEMRELKNIDVAFVYKNDKVDGGGVVATSNGNIGGVHDGKYDEFGFWAQVQF